MRFLFFLFFFILTVNDSFSQTDSISRGVSSIPSDTLSHLSKSPNKKPASNQTYSHDMLKINLYSLLIKNYSISFERFLTKKISVQVGYRYAPYDYISNNILGKFIRKEIAVDPQLLGFQTSNNTFSLDIRKYSGRKPGAKGFFIGLYGRYTMLDIDNISYTYVDQKGKVFQVPLAGNLNGIGGGLLLGFHFLIKKRISFEYDLFGGHYGSWKGTIYSNKDLSGLTIDDKATLKSNLEDLYNLYNIKYLNATVSDTGVQGKISGPFFGFRSGIWIGIAF